MADLIWLSAGEAPPWRVDHVLVQAAASGGYAVDGYAAWLRETALLYAPPPEPDLEAAMALAEAWADENGVPAVYVATP